MGHWLYGTMKDEGRTMNEQAEAVHPSSFILHPCDLIVANIIARVLAVLAHDMAAVLKPGGILIASGIIAEREPEVAEAFAAAGLAPLERKQEGDWVALVYRKSQAEGEQRRD